MSTLYEPEEAKKAIDYRQELLASFHRKQTKHLTSMSKALSSVKGKWVYRYNFDSNKITNILHSNIKDNEVVELFGEIPKPFRLYNWGQMESLSITHRQCYLFRVDSSNAIVMGIKRMKNLKSLNLNFPQCYSLNNEVFQKLISSISRQLFGLKHLALNFEACTMISNYSLTSFALELSRGFLHLQSLTLILIDCMQLSDIGVIELLTALNTYSVKLQKLSLNLSRCYGVTQKTLELFSTGSKCRHLRNLQQLTLNFAWNSKVDDECLGNFIDGLCQYYTNLNLLSLNFSACNEVSDRGFIAVGSRTVKSLKQLENLLLNFAGCGKITNNALETVTTDIKMWKPNLKQLKIGLVGCSKVTSDVKRAAKTNLKHIPKLEIN